MMVRKRVSTALLFLINFLYMCSLPSILSSYHGVFQKQEYENYTFIRDLLPTVLMLPVNTNFYQKAINNRGANIFQLTDHAQDIYFYNWYQKHYEKKMNLPLPAGIAASGSQSKQRRLPRRSLVELEETLTDNSIDLFYVPSGASVKEMQHDWWFRLDADLQAIISSKQIPNLVLDHSFVVASFPGQTRPIQIINPAVRNVRDLRFFRSDNDMTPNGRDVYIPYAVIRKKYQTNYNESNSLFLSKKRKYFLMAVCREAAGGGEAVRLWRTLLFRQLSQAKELAIIENSLITENLSIEEFNQGLLNADFCMIVPGDTPSTSKLYKAIFAGCIPVIFVSFPTQLPFSSLLNWPSFSIVLYKDVIRMSPSKIDALLTRLQQIRDNTFLLNQYKENMKKVANYFDYSRLAYPSIYHLALLELKLSIQRDEQLLTII